MKRIYYITREEKLNGEIVFYQPELILGCFSEFKNAKAALDAHAVAEINWKAYNGFRLKEEISHTSSTLTWYDKILSFGDLSIKFVVRCMMCADLG